MNNKQLFFPKLPQPQRLQWPDPQVPLRTAERQANNLRGWKRKTWDEMFSELMAESQKKTRLTESWRLFRRTQTEKEMAVAIDSIVMAKESMKKGRCRGNSWMLSWGIILSSQIFLCSRGTFHFHHPYILHQCSQCSYPNIPLHRRT